MVHSLLSASSKSPFQGSNRATPLRETFIAHRRSVDGEIQTVTTHLLGVSEGAKVFAAKVGLPSLGRLTGLMHDFGKFSSAFQAYISSATALLDPDKDEDWVDAKQLKGKIDHSTAGAQWIDQVLARAEGGSANSAHRRLCAEMMALCVASHHSGLVDCVNKDGQHDFRYRRLRKPESETHLLECEKDADAQVLQAARSLASTELVDEFSKVAANILDDANNSKRMQAFQLGLLTRFLFSALIDADRIDSTDFETPTSAEARSKGCPDWSVPLNRLEQHLNGLAKGEGHTASAIDTVRRDISARCKARASEAQGVYTLSVPTGGGKTLASLRYALHHAQIHQLDRIIFIIPYTSIIEQNAREVRRVLEHPSDARPWVLEHHSNLEPEKQSWQSKLFAENWDSPIVFTTMVQFLEACFSGGTRGARRFHQLANSVLIFDEVQTLPIRCTHLFCNTINFLAAHARTTAVLCTATQPNLHDLPQPELGQIHLAPCPELAGDASALRDLYSSLDRVDIVNRCETPGWGLKAMCDFVLEEFGRGKQVLVVVNTKAWARELFQAFELAEVSPNALFHLSTNQCAAHRDELLNGPTCIKQRLKSGLPVLCVSTQLIEAGVDISFACVVRFLAGLDSLAQAAGRCNRHGDLEDATGRPTKGKVFLVRPDHEATDMLPEIEIGKQMADRVFRDLASGCLQGSAVSPMAVKQYFQYFFYQRKDLMTYPLDDGTRRNLLSLLSDNRRGQGGNAGSALHSQAAGSVRLLQSFKEAGDAFKAIDAPTQSVISQFGCGRQWVTQLCGLDPRTKEFKEALTQSQRFSINVFPSTWQQLLSSGAVCEIQNTGIYFLHDGHYDDRFGLSVDGFGTKSSGRADGSVA